MADHPFGPIRDLSRWHRSGTGTQTGAVLARGSTLMDLNGIGPCDAARLLADVDSIHAFRVSGPVRLLRTAPRPWTRRQEITSGTGCLGPATARSTTFCTPWPWSSCVIRPRAGSTTTARRLPGRPPWRRCGHSNDACTTWSTNRYSPTSGDATRQAREGTRGRLLTPARPALPRTPILRTSHNPDLPPPSPTTNSQLPLDIKVRSHERMPRAGTP